MPKILVFALLLTTAIPSAVSLQRKSMSQQAPSAGPGERVPYVTSKALPAVVLVVALDKSGKELSQGSGFFVSHDGKVITNYHVIENASSAIIKCQNGALYPVDGTLNLDQADDIAVLKIDGKDFPALPLGDSAAVRIGQQVIAIGSPLALEGTVSDGIVSAIREIKDRSLKVIQTTAPISPGSSGGALLNMSGQVIGITAYHLMPGENINFAIVVDYIKPLLASLTVSPFHPKQTKAAQNPAPQGGAAQEPLSIPSHWMMMDGNPITVRIDGNHLYEFVEGPGDGTYAREIREICDSKRDGTEWVGECHERVLLQWGSAISETWCDLDLGERITSVTPTRIEGESQKIAKATSFSSCPSPGAGWVHFFYVPLAFGQ